MAASVEERKKIDPLDMTAHLYAFHHLNFRFNIIELQKNKY